MVSNISKYDIDQLEDNILKQILFFEMKFGDDVEFEVYFDYDFEK